MQPPGNACCSTLGPARFHLFRSDCCRAKLFSSQSLMLQDRPAFIWTAGGIVIRSGVNLNKPYILTAVHLFRNNDTSHCVEFFKWFVNHCTTTILIYVPSKQPDILETLASGPSMMGFIETHKLFIWCASTTDYHLEAASVKMTASH